MLILQAKHFGFDAKNKLNQVHFQHVHEKNRLYELSKKNELSLNQANNTFKIRPREHYKEIGEMFDKINAIDDGKPRGLKVTNKYRHNMLNIE